MSDKKIAAMQQALEAMLHFPGDISDEMFESIRSLKAALAEPQTVNEAYEACELLKRMGFKWYELEESWYPSAPAKPEQEPVAVRWRWPGYRWTVEHYEPGRFEARYVCSLYTTPPARRACWCATCDKAEHILPTRMSVCPRCGDKRCPRADFHGNECREEGGNDE